MGRLAGLVRALPWDVALIATQSSFLPLSVIHKPTSRGFKSRVETFPCSGAFSFPGTLSPPEWGG